MLTDDKYWGSTKDAHWIPNTNEILPIEEIGIRVFDQNRGEMLSVPTELNEIKILPPRDPTFLLLEAANNTKSNVNTNKGSGLIFYVVPAEGAPYELATFTKKPYADTLTADTLYDVTYNQAYFTAAGRAKEGYKLFLVPIYENSSYIIGNSLQFSDNTDPNNLKGITRFGVKAFGTIRPGDDFLLRFGLASEVGKPGVAKEGQFVAVYDKKMMWRAQLYKDDTIDEDGKFTGDPDWNDFYPWTGDANNPNEWRNGYIAMPNNLTQAIYDSMINVIDNSSEKQVIAGLYSKDNATNIYSVKANITLAERNNGIAILQKENVVHKPGGQCAIKPWVRLFKVNNVDFNYYTRIVRNSVAYSRACVDSVASFNEDMAEQITCIGAELPVDNEWLNYEDTPRVINGKTYYAYRPMLQSVYNVFGAAYCGDANMTYQQSIQRSAGTECSGFVQQAASYGGNPYNPYVLNDLGNNRDVWDKNNAQSLGEYCSGINSDSWAINTGEAYKMVPGDILWMSGYVGIVCRIKYTVNSREVAKYNTDINIIDATGYKWVIQNIGRNWDTYANSAGRQFKRLSVK